MRLLYFTPNHFSIIEHIEKILNHRYGQNDLPVNDERALKHTTLIYEIDQEDDPTVSGELLKLITSAPPGLWNHFRLVEMPGYYYLSISDAALSYIATCEESNDFARLLIEKSKSASHGDARTIPGTGKLTKIKDHQIPYNAGFQYTLLDDTRYLSEDFYRLVGYTTLPPEEISKLFTVSVWLNCSISTLYDLINDGYIVSDNDMNRYEGSIRFATPELKDAPVHLPLSVLAREANVSPDSVYMDVTANRILNLIRHFMISTPHSQDVIDAITPGSVRVDTFVTLTIDQLKKFYDESQGMVTKSYYKLFNRICWDLMRADRGMGFVFNDQLFPY